MLQDRICRRSLAIAITQRRSERAIMRGVRGLHEDVISDVDVGGGMLDFFFLPLIRAQDPLALLFILPKKVLLRFIMQNRKNDRLFNISFAKNYGAKCASLKSI